MLIKVHVEMKVFILKKNLSVIPWEQKVEMRDKRIVLKILRKTFVNIPYILKYLLSHEFNRQKT